MFRHRQQRTSALALLLGLLATGLVLLAYVRGGLDWLEHRTLDLRFQWPWTNSIPFSNQLVSVDIDDSALATIGRWPWPRDVQAALVSVPAECGAKAILVDLDWSEREIPRLDLPPDADLVEVEVVDGDAAQRIDPDLALRAAIAEAGNVFPAFTNYHADRIEQSPQFAAALHRRLNGRDQEAAAIVREFAARSYTAHELNAAQRVDLATVFAREPALSEAAAAERLKLEAQAVINASLTCRLAALAYRLQAWIQEQPSRAGLGPAQLLEAFFHHLTGADYYEQSQTVLVDAVAIAVRDYMGYKATLRAWPISPDAIRQLAVPVEGIKPVYFRIAEYAAGPGFVNFMADVDGVMRREPLVERHGEHATLQLALAAGCITLGVNEIAAADADTLLLKLPDRPPIRFQLDPQRRVVVPWTTRARMEADPRQFVPAATVCELANLRLLKAKNRVQALQIMRRLAESPRLSAHRSVGDLVQAVQRAAEHVEQARLSLQPRTLAAAREMLADFEKQLDRAWTALRTSAEPLRPDEAAPGAPADLVDIAHELAEYDRFMAANSGLERECAALLDVLRPRFEGRICLVGYTASALADMKPSPLQGSMPGVRSHLNLLNGLLTGRTVSWADPARNALLATLLGFVISLISTFYRRWALPVALLNSALIVAVAWWAFYQYTYWLAVVPSLAAVWLSYLTIALYQFSFVDRERRELTKALGQYTSATLARRMADQPDLCKRAETREVTAIFTDLAGFTGISERIGAERTQRVLNVSLGRFTDVLLRQEAMVNKFIGDGVFAFWNPLIHPQDDHAQRGCLAALQLFDALEMLEKEQRYGGGDEAFGELRLRVGLATGSAVVGPCGSEQKYDYTCIGDSVNLAARLESANKFFGTRILVNGRLVELVGDGYAFRPLGRVQVKGKKLGVPVFELLGRHSVVGSDALEYGRRFFEGVEAYQARNLDQAQQVMTACAALRADDAAASAYLHAVALARARPMDDDWTGALELTEK